MPSSSSSWWACFGCMNIRNRDDVICLDFSHQSLHDVPPDVFQYERTLEELHINSNRISDLPRQLFYCQELRIIYLNDNELATVPPAISSLTNLQKINLARNALTTIPDTIKSCKHLQSFDLSVNSLERVPEAIINLTLLQELYLNDTFLEYLPANMGRLVNLKILEVRDNNLITLPKSMARLTNLTRLDIGHNEFTELPDIIGHLTNIVELWIDSNRIRRISPNVGNLRKLQHFEGSNNLLNYLPNEIGNWIKLQELSISANELEHLPFSIGMLKCLVTLKADENQLQELPESICQLDSLEELMVSHNDLFRLPPSIGVLRKLRYLTADENLLRHLPNELCSCSALTILSARGNKLTDIPPDIGRLTNLRVLNIVNNFITHLPVSLLSLTQLSAIWISDNQSIPLMPMQKEYGPEQSVHLTCFMLPQVLSSTETPSINQHHHHHNHRHNSHFQEDDEEEEEENEEPQQQQQNQHQHEQDINNDDEDDADADADADVDDNDQQTSPKMTSTSKQSSIKRTYYANPPHPISPTQLATTDHHQISRQQIRTPNTSATKRRICFASDPIANSVEQTSRLMRSPTPYPKELRVLAKYAKNMQKCDSSQQTMAIDGTTHSDDYAQIDDLKVMSKNTDQLNENGSSLYSRSDYFDKQQKQHEHERLLPAQGSTMSTKSTQGTSENELSEVTNQAAYYYATVDKKNPSTGSGMRLSTDSNGIGAGIGTGSGHGIGVGTGTGIGTGTGSGGNIDYECVSGAGSDNEKINRIAYTNRDSTIKNGCIPDCIAYPYTMYHQSSHQYNQNQLSTADELMYMNNQSIWDSSRDIYTITKAPFHLDQQQQMQQLQQLQQLQQQQQQQQQQQHPSTDQYPIKPQPPPYHIAKAFTKKSKQDLIIYDKYRHMNTDGGNGHDYQIPPPPPPVLSMTTSTNNINSINSTNSSKSNENQSENGEPYRSASISAGENQQQYLDTNLNSPPSDRDRLSPVNDMKNYTDNILDVNHFCQTDGNGFQLSSIDYQNVQNHTNKLPWLFGLHKNPTVMQLSLPKDPEIGFRMMEKPKQGIFVSSVYQSSSANGVLLANDKILDIDGVDCTRATLKEALTILSNSGPMVNIMISRK